ncbi:MAG: aldo/keto reductase [Nitrospirota bacterium]|nr:aldo/keto reductase [Nitrospirota bacterium]
MDKGMPRRKFFGYGLGLGTVLVARPWDLFGGIASATEGPRALVARTLGKTNRAVTTFGLGGQASIQWTPEGIDPVALIAKAIMLGTTYLDTSNVYGPSQANFGKAFQKLDLIPGEPVYNEPLRRKIFLASKTMMRYTAPFEGDLGPGSRSNGESVKGAIDDVKRSLSLIFGDGRGDYPKGAYLDLVQIHNIQSFEHVDAIYAGLENPAPKAGPVGALAGLLDLRDGTNRTGFNPGNERLIGHIGITGHWNSPAHMYAIQKDSRGILDTLLVAINANDRLYFNHQYNAIPLAKAKGMGVIAMKVFADGAFYGKTPRFSSAPSDVVHAIGSDAFPSKLAVRYSLSIPGVDTAIMGIGNERQLLANIQAAQLKGPLSEAELRAIEGRAKDALGNATNYFQRPYEGLSAPKNARVELDMPYGKKDLDVRVLWNTAYAGDEPLAFYEVLKDGKPFKRVQAVPQTSLESFFVMDALAKETAHTYQVRVIDRAGRSRASQEVMAKA